MLGPSGQRSARISPATPGRPGGQPRSPARPAALRVACRAIAERPSSRSARGPWRTPDLWPLDLHRVPERKVPAARTTPAGSSDRPDCSSARRAPASTTSVPDEARAKAIHNLRAGRRRDRGGAGTPCRPPGSRQGRRRAPRASGVGDDRPHSRPGGDLGGGQFGGHAPTAHARAGSARHCLQLVVDLDHLFDQRRLRSPPRVGCEEACGVGEQDQEPGVDQVSDKGRQPVVVAEADLLVGHRVVLVDHGHHAERCQVRQGSTGLEVLLAVHQVGRREQHLAGGQTVGGQPLPPAMHQLGLADRRHGLQLRGLPDGRTVSSEHRPACGDGPRGDHDHRLAPGMQPRDLVAQTTHDRCVHLSIRRRHRGRSDLHHDGARMPHAPR